MAPRWFGKVGFSAKKPVQAPQPSSASSAPSPPQSGSSTAIQAISRPTACPSPATDSTICSLPTLQERLWNEAYDELASSEPKLAEAYENIISTELYRSDPAPVTNQPMENRIERTREARCRQMQQLVQQGLNRTEKAASLKRGIDEGLQAVEAVREVVDKAIHAAPEAAIAWAGVCLGLEILSNPITEARDNRKGIAYILSRMEWYWNLVSLLLDENKAEQSVTGLRAQLENHIAQLYKNLLAYQMKSVCLYHRNWAATIGRDLLKVDDWAGHLSGIHEAEHAVQRDMEQYNTEESKVRLRKLVDSAKAIETNLQGIHSAIQDQTRQQEKRHRDDKNEQCLKDLRETDPRDDKTRIQNTKGGLLRDSYRWILQHDDSKKWRDDSQGQLLWIKGDPGKGKTMLLCGIIDELEKESANLLSYFFCQATEHRLSNATAVLRGLVYLLVQQQPSLVLYIRQKYDHAGKQLFEDLNAWESLSKIFTAMLNDPSLEGAILIIDALDECKTSRHQLLDLIVRPSRVKWIVSSRNWQDIEEKLDNAEQKVGLSLELNKTSTSKAVETYIGYKVEQLARDKNYDQETKQAVERHLNSNADGTFLWVALVCQELADPKTRKRHSLSKLQSFPRGLDSLYSQMVEHVCDSEDADLCREVLAIASVVYRPVNHLQIWTRMRLNKSLPRVDVVYFLHQSAKDYLLNKAFGYILPSGTAHQHRAILLNSLERLSEILQRDVYGLKAPGVDIDDISTPDPDPLSRVRYSCLYWVDHLDESECDTKMANEALNDEGVVHEFFRTKYLYWLEALSLLRSMSEGVLAMEKLWRFIENSGSNKLKLTIRDARRFILSNKRVIEMAPLQAYVSALMFSPTESLVRGFFKKEQPNWVRLVPNPGSDWDSCLQTLEGHNTWVSCIAVSPDGQQLASASDFGEVKVWNIATGACIQTFEDLDHNRQRILDIATGLCVQTLKGHGASVSSVAISDVQRLASGSSDQKIKIWDIATCECLRTLVGHEGSVTAVTFLGSQQLVSSSLDRTIKIWDIRTGVCVQTLEGHSDAVSSVVVLDNRRLASGSMDNIIKVWDTSTGTCLQTLEGHTRWVSSVAFSADNQRLASGSGDGMVKVWDIPTSTCIETLSGHGDAVTSVNFLVDSQRLVSCSRDATLKIWDTGTGSSAHIPDGYGFWVHPVVFSSDFRWLAAGSNDSRARIWDVTTGGCVRTFEGHHDSVFCVDISSNSRLLASSSREKTIKIWDATTGACFQTLEGHTASVLHICISTDGQRLASGSFDFTARVWDVKTGECMRTLEGHTDLVSSVAFSPDGHRLISCSYDMTARVWEISTGECMQVLEGHNSKLASAAFSADNQYLASCTSGMRRLELWICRVFHLPLDNESVTAVTQQANRVGYGISSNGEWVVKGRQEELIWLPTEYRASSSAVARSTIALGCRSGRVLFLKFS
uniref:NACHT domain-containing protein n=1 Tax=Bionectria ochroleuca TaxID=29856 RepID=A0A0B7JQF2_BIOOC